MLAYAAENPRPAGRAGSPKALTLIVAGHAVLIGAVMTAKMDVIRILPTKPPIVFNVPPPPVEPEVKPHAEPQIPQTTFIDRVPPAVPMEPVVPHIPIQEGPIVQPLPPAGGVGGGIIVAPPRHVPALSGPRLATAGDALKPPYPSDKLRLEQEATLKLRLTID